MPPHCDSLDGPVVGAARRALDTGNVDLVLPFVTEDGEEEVRRAFARVMRARREGPGSQEVADLHFFETVVRVHRAGEGAPYTGLKPAGIDVGPVIPVAERAIATGQAEDLTDLLVAALDRELARRFHRVMELRRHAAGPVADARRYVDAMLGFQVWAHAVYVAATAEEHREARAPGRPGHVHAA
jgi:hypothetical protein